MTENMISSSEISRVLSEIGLNIEIQDVFVGEYGQILKLVNFELYDRNSNSSDEDKYYGVFVIWDNDEKLWVEPKLSKIKSFRYIKKDLIKIDGTPEEFIRESLQSLITPPKVEEEIKDTETTAITTPSSKDRLVLMRDQMKMIQNKTEAMVRVVQNMLSDHNDLVRQMRNKVAELEKIILLAETFLGIYQEIHVLQSGVPASGDTPLYIRQRVAFMDEEVGDITREGGVVGIDFNRIDDFDNWLMTNKRYEYLIPEEKCIMAVRPTNHKNNYSGNVFKNAEMNQVNNWMYLLIRNGENIYRIWAEMEVGKLLFPPAEVYEQIMKALLEGRSEKYWSEQSAKEADFHWRRFAILVEGMFYHSTILQPHPPDISLFRQESYEQNHVILIRDGEPSFTDGRIRYKEWKDEINASIRVGSRIILADNMHEHLGRMDDFDSWRWGDKYYRYKPENPKAGVYEIIEEKMINRRWLNDKPEKAFKIRYYPKYRWTDATRRLSFWFVARDSFVLNYDMIDLGDVNYFIGSRIERDDYRAILPSLYLIRDELIDETKHESDFINLISNEMSVPKEIVRKAVDWWKYKNIYKRPIKKDDNKAWRMIRKRLKRYLDNPDEVSFETK